MNTVINPPAWLTNCFPETSEGQDWLRAFQQTQADLFLQRGVPTRREELWKYTDVSYLEKLVFSKPHYTADKSLEAIVKKHRLPQIETMMMVFVNGHFAESLSDLNLLPEGVVLSGLQAALKTRADQLKPYLTTTVSLHRHPFSSLNSALMTDGLFLQVPKNIVVKTPIQVLYLNTGTEPFLSCPRNLILADENSQVTLFEQHLGIGAAQYFSNSQTDVHTGNNAQVEYYRIQNESQQATHIAQTFVHQNKDSRVTLSALQIGGKMARDDIYVNLNERGAECSVNAFYALNRDDQHLDNHVQIDHIASHGNSQMMYKGILDRKSHAVFNGKIYVHSGAQKTQSQQANHNLLLSKEAQIDTKPEFEIYADDVKCAHGDTVGQLDQEALFYLRARGINQQDALKMLTRAFADDVMTRIAHPAISAYMNALLNETLRHEE